MGSVERRHVALLAFPFGTHAAPLFSLARAIAAAAPDDTVFSFVSTDRSNASVSRSDTSGRIRFYDLEADLTSARNHKEAVGIFMKETPGNYRKALEAAVAGSGGVRVTCVVSDAFLWFVGEMAAEMGLPWVALWTGGPSSLSSHLYTDLLRSRLGEGPKADGDEDLGFVPGLSGLRARDLPDNVVGGDLSSGFARLLHRMGTDLPNLASAVVHNSFQGLHPALDSDFASKFSQSLPIGPLHLLSPNPPEPDRFHCLPWLDRHAPSTVAYVSFGTVAALPPAELAELASGLEASGVPFLWSLRDSVKDQLPAGFLDRNKDRGLVVSWVPQLAVLGHVAVGAFVTHCGWNSVMESVTCGVPMVCRPFLGDQGMNARVVSHVWRVGVGIGGGPVKREDVSRALETVVKGEEGKGMRERIGELKEEAVRAVGPDGSSAQNFKVLLEMVVGL